MVTHRSWPTLAPPIVWQPEPARAAASNMARFAGSTGRGDVSYEALWDWSVTDLDGFWSTFTEWYGVRWHDRPTRALGMREMPRPEWFPEGTLNFAEHVLFPPCEPAATAVAVRALREDGSEVRLDWHMLRAQVAGVRSWLVAAGVGAGDRVAAVLPNAEHAVVAMLATASIGAVWSSCSPDFGVTAVTDRFAQIEPRVLIVADGYRYGGRAIDIRERVLEMRAQLPSVEHTILVRFLDGEASLPGAVYFDGIAAQPGDLAFATLPFNAPLYILYSSGTTGLPKPIVHGHGNLLVEHAKHLSLHLDLGPGEVFFWFTTTGWMMWNLLISGLLVGATVVLYDGSPGWPEIDRLWQVAADTRATVFGTSAGYLQACLKAGVKPASVGDLSSLEVLGSTGSPLAPECYSWIADEFEASVLLASSSGGTDVCSAFVGAAPLLPVRVGRIPCRMLACRVETYDDDGRPVVGVMGELVVTAPMPSMPVGLWNDAGDLRLHESYYARFPGVWTHGDWITMFEDGSLVVHGRSDATLNRGGVRMGTGEFYGLVEDVPGVSDSLVIDTSTPAGEGELLLFVVLAPGAGFDEVSERLRTRIRAELSPRHVPDRVVAVPAVPRTLTGKKCEVPVKRILGGTPVDRAVSRGALADAEALSFFIAFAPLLAQPD